MKFKALFLLFNIVLFSTFLLLFFLPAVFFKSITPTSIISLSLFLLFIALVDYFCIANKNFFIYMEDNNWNELATLLEKRIFEKGKLNNSNLKMLCNAYVLLSRFDAIERLEIFVKEIKPTLYEKNILIFVTNSLLKTDFENAKTKICAIADKLPKNDLVQFFAGFSHYVTKNFSEAFTYFNKVLLDTKDCTLQSFCTFFIAEHLANVLDDSLVQNAVQNANATKQKIVQSYTKQKWQQLMQKQKSELYGLVLSPLIPQVEAFLYA